MGDSAGGNLAAVVALETRCGRPGGPDVPPPVAQGLVYPALDARLDSPSAHAFGEGFFLTRQSMEFFRRLLPPRPRPLGVAAGLARSWPMTTAGSPRLWW